MMKLAINPLTINENPEFASILKVFLLESIKQGITCWYRDLEFPVPPSLCQSWTTFTLTSSLLFRPRNFQKDSFILKKGYRMEVFNETLPPIAKGAYGTIYITLGTIALTELTINFHFKKPRVIKFFHSNGNNTPQNETLVSPPHMHAKPPVIIKSIEGTSNAAIVMKYLGDRNLKQLLAQQAEATYTPLEQGRQLTLALLYAYRQQIENYGLIHRDIKPENIMVTLENENTPILHFIDVDTRCSSTGLSQSPNLVSLLSPLIEPSSETSSLFPIYPDSSNVRRHISMAVRQDQLSYTPVGTFGYIPPEGYMTPPVISPKYDLFALARVIAEIWKIQIQHYRTPTDYERAKQNAFHVTYTFETQTTTPLSAEVIAQIESILTRLANVDPAQRPSIQEALDVFHNLPYIQELQSSLYNS